MAITDITKEFKEMQEKIEICEKDHDPVNHPTHYRSSKAKCSHCGEGIECIDVTRHMNFNIGNAVKYLWRWQHKAGIEDLKKARWYLNDAIEELEGKLQNGII